MRLLLVEDHRALSEMIEEHLERVGFAVDPVLSAEDARAAINVTAYDIIVLDLGLPGADGMTVLDHVRGGDAPGVPVLILTARDSLGSRLEGLNAGADDYLVKPFDLQELEARLRAILRRPGYRRVDTLEFGGITFCVTSWGVQVNGQPVDLGRKEAALLEELMRVAPRIVVRDRLEDKMYALHETVTANAIEAIVSRLRRKLQSCGAAARIVSVRGIGYRLASGVEDDVG